MHSVQESNVGTVTSVHVRLRDDANVGNLW